MNYPRIFERVYLNPLCVTSERFASIHAFLLPRLTGRAALEVGALAVDDRQPRAAAGDGPKPQNPVQLPNGKRSQFVYPDAQGRLFKMAAPGIASIPVYGVLAKNLSSWEESCGGGTDITPLAHALAQAVADPSIKKIALDIDSPGGEVTGIPEFAAAIRGAAKAKPVLAFTEAGTCSAAYWLASQCTSFHCTASATTGSVGTYLAWLDEGIRMQMEGVQLQLFAAGKHKGIGLPGRALSHEDRALLQSRVDTLNGWFTNAVQHGRGAALGLPESMAGHPVIDPACLEGQTFTGAQAVEQGMADGIVSGWEEFLKKLAA